MISYSPFWETLKGKNKTTYYLIKKHGISSKTIQKLRDNLPVNMTTIDTLCQILNCKIGDIVEICLDSGNINGDDEIDDIDHIAIDYNISKDDTVFNIENIDPSLRNKKKLQNELQIYIKSFLAQNEERMTEIILNELKKDLLRPEIKNAARTPEQAIEYAKGMRKKLDVPEDASINKEI